VSGGFLFQAPIFAIVATLLPASFGLDLPLSLPLKVTFCLAIPATMFVALNSAFFGGGVVALETIVHGTRHVIQVTMIGWNQMKITLECDVHWYQFHPVFFDADHADLEVQEALDEDDGLGGVTTFGGVTTITENCLSVDAYCSWLGFALDSIFSNELLAGPASRPFSEQLELASAKGALAADTQFDDGFTLDELHSSLAFYHKNCGEKGLVYWREKKLVLGVIFVTMFLAIMALYGDEIAVRKRFTKLTSWAAPW